MSELQQRLLAGTVAVAAAEAIDTVMAMPAALIVAISDGLGRCKRERERETEDGQDGNAPDMLVPT